MKTLYIDIDEDISDILKKMSALKGKHILFVIPKKAHVFQNAVNLKLLQKKAKEEEKVLQIFTNDPKGLQMVKNVGIKLYEGHASKRKTVKKAKLSSLPKGGVKKSEKRVSITEVSEKTRKQHHRNTSSGPQKKRKRKDHKEWATFFQMNTVRKKTLLGLSVVAVVFFGLVAYVAIPSATVYLTPASNILEATTNVTLAQPEENADLFRNPSTHAIPAFPIDLTFDKRLEYKPTGKVFTGKSARCNIKVFNERTSPWTLIPQTRFQDRTGVVFRIKDSLEVPAARFEVVKDEEGNASRVKTPGSLIVNVEADEFDENENIIGARGNLAADTEFLLPGLSEFNQQLLYGRNESPCVGGVTDFFPIVTEDDLEAAREKMIAELESEARQYLVDYVEGENVRLSNSTNPADALPKMVLFDHSDAILYEIRQVEVPENLLDKQVEFIEINGSMRVQGLAYESQLFEELISQGLLARVHPSKVLSDIDFDSATQNIVYSDSDLDSLSKVKVSVTARGVEEYNFDPRDDEGREIVDKILDYVPGTTKTDALYFIANLEEIQKATISIWPIWKGDMPTRRSSISIEVQ